MEEELAKPFELRLIEMKQRMGGVDIKLESPMMLLISSMFVVLIKGFKGADNYLSFEVIDPKTIEVYQIMIQRKNGLFPTDIVNRQKIEIEQLKAIIEELKLNQPDV